MTSYQGHKIDSANTSDNRGTVCHSTRTQCGGSTTRGVGRPPTKSVSQVAIAVTNKNNVSDCRSTRGNSTSGPATARRGSRVKKVSVCI